MKIKLHVTLLCLCTPLLAQESKKQPETDPVNTMGTIYVIEKYEEKINEKTLSQSELEKGMIFDVQDIVRHLPDVGVASDGRFGSNGYSMRGVDKDRIAISVDNIPQAETFDNLIYKGYGYFNGSINDIETEHLKSVTLSKGADSIFMGSGALGGAVQYITKEPGDLITSGDYGVVSRTAYTSKNKEWMETIGVSARSDLVDGMFLYTYRKGHETKNHTPKNDVFGSGRGTPDPQNKNRESILAKLSIRPTEKNTLNLTIENGKLITNTDEKSWNLFSGYHRVGDDTSRKERYSISNIYEPLGVIESITNSFDWQKITQTAFSSIYEDYIEGKYSNISEEKRRSLIQSGKFFSNEIISSPINFFSSNHTITARTQYNERTLDNKNNDTIWLGSPKTPYHEENKIIRPVNTNDLSIAIVDEIKTLDDKLGFVIGGRYDNVKHNPDTKPLHLAKDSKPEKNRYSAMSLAMTASYDINREYTLQYKLGQGFRIPTAQELYFDYGDSVAANRVEPNPNLKQEKAISNEIAISYNGSTIKNKVNIYHTKYSDFIDLKQTERFVKNPWFDSSRPNSYWNKPLLSQNHLQYTNVSSAQVFGGEISNEVNISKIFGLTNEYAVHNAISYARGKDSDGNSLLSIQPLKMVSSISYNSKNGVYGSELFMTYADKKRGGQAISNGKEWKYLSDSYTVFDMTGYYNINKNATIRAGVFNILDRKYSTWDSLRSIPEFGTTNRIDHEGKGLERFTAPGRNFAADISIYF